ncbi:MAG TPA: hypothetical protein PKD85_00620 [Saprospiraceae bacterium]|nr:hypothetical protein [Saprospiraceae bacterium]
MNKVYIEAIYWGGMLLSMPYVLDRSYHIQKENHWPNYKGFYYLLASEVIWPVSVPYFIVIDSKKKD